MKFVAAHMNKWSILILVMFLFGFILPDSNWETVTASDMSKEIKSMEEFYKNTSAYSIKIVHRTYRNYSATKIEDESTGFFIKDAKNNYHSYSMGIRTIQNSKMKLTIDSLNKSILLNEPDSYLSKEVKISELKDLLKLCSAIKMNKEEGAKKYRFEFNKGGSYSAYEIWANSSSQIKKLILFFNTEVLTDPSDEKSAKTKPRAEISFSDYTTGITPDYKKYFDETPYIQLKNEKYSGVGKYKGFEVLDLRVKN